MAGKSRIVGAVKSCRSSCGYHNGFGFDGIECIILNTDGKCAVYFIVGNGNVDDVHSVEHRYIGELFYRRRKEGLDVLAVYLDVSVSTGNVFSVFVLKDNKSHILKLLCDLVEALGH